MRTLTLLAVSLLVASCEALQPPAQHFQPGLWGMAVSFDPRPDGTTPEPRFKVCLTAEDAAAKRLDPAEWFLSPYEVRPQCGKQTAAMQDGRIQAVYNCTGTGRLHSGRKEILDVEGEFTPVSFEVKVYRYLAGGATKPAKTGWNKKVDDAVGRGDPYARGWGPSLAGRRLGDC